MTASPDLGIPLKRRLFYMYSALRYQWDGLLYRSGLWHGPSPTPHVVKRRIVREMASRYHLSCLVETGTYLGDMIAALLPYFDQLYSIELSDVFFQKARARFARQSKVRLRHGDSASAISGVLAECDRPALFWLDAHYSGGNTARADRDTPVVDELRRILGDRSRRHVLLVDDARAFNGSDGYPTIDEVRALVGSLRPEYRVEVAQDIIRILPPVGERP